MGSGSVFYLIIVTILALVILHYHFHTDYHAVGAGHLALGADYHADHSDIVEHHNDSEEVVIESCSHPPEQDHVR